MAVQKRTSMINVQQTLYYRDVVIKSLDTQCTPCCPHYAYFLVWPIILECYSHTIYWPNICIFWLKM